MRIVHYLNQFFGGVGGEEKAGMGLEVREGATGPGKLFEQIMDADAKVAVTLVCGDNYAVENLAAMIAAALEQIRNEKQICLSVVHAFRPAAMGWPQARFVPRFRRN